jgi:hypothetical protein
LPDIFDQIAAPKGDIFDQVALPPRASPERSTLGEIGHGIERGLKTLGYGALKGTQAFWEVPATLTDMVSGATGLPSGGAFHRLAEMAEPPAEWAPQGLPEKISAGAGQAAVAIPEIMSGAKVLGTGTRAMAALGGIRGAREGGLPGAARGAAEGALLGGVLHGARALPKVAAVPVTGAAFALPSAMQGAPGEDIIADFLVGGGLAAFGPSPSWEQFRSLYRQRAPEDVTSAFRSLQSQEVQERMQQVEAQAGQPGGAAPVRAMTEALKTPIPARRPAPAPVEKSPLELMRAAQVRPMAEPVKQMVRSGLEPAPAPKPPTPDVAGARALEAARGLGQQVIEREVMSPEQREAAVLGRSPAEADRRAALAAEEEGVSRVAPAPALEEVAPLAKTAVAPPAPAPRPSVAARGERPSAENFAKFMGKTAKKWVDEAHGEEILSSLIKKGESPKDVSERFWRDTYPSLPREVQAKMEHYLTNITGLRPGMNGGEGILKSWQDVAKLDDMPGIRREEGMFGYPDLEGTERGYVSLMAYANEQAVKAPQPRQLPAPRPEAPKAGRNVAGTSPAEMTAIIRANEAAGLSPLTGLPRRAKTLSQQARAEIRKVVIESRINRAGKEAREAAIGELEKEWATRSEEWTAMTPDERVAALKRSVESLNTARADWVYGGMVRREGKKSVPLPPEIETAAKMGRAKTQAEEIAKAKPPPLTLEPTPRGEPPAPAPETGQGTLASQLRQFPAPPQSVRPKVEARPEQQQTLGAAITKPDWEGVRARQQAKKGRIIEPQTYHQYAKQAGGLRETPTYAGELDEFKRFPGLVNKSGAHMDELAERSIKDGWLPEGSTESDALNLLKLDLRNKVEGKPRIRERPSTAEIRAQDEAEMRDRGGIKAGELAGRLKPGDKVRGALAGTKEDTYTYQGKKGGKVVFRDKETVRLAPGQWVEEPTRVAKGEGGPEFGMGLGVLGERPVEKVKAEAAAAVKGATDWAKRKGWMTPDEVDAIKDTDYTNIAKFAQLPDDVARSQPEYKPLYGAEQARERERSSMQVDLFKTGRVGDTYFRLKPQEQAKTNAVLDKANRQKVGRFEDYQLDGMGLGAKEKTAYKAMRDVMEFVEKDFPRQLREMGFEESEVAALEGQIKAHPGYMPQVRLGDWRVVIKGKDGETAYAGGAASKAEANRMALDIAKEYPTGQGFTRPKVFKSKRLPEEVFMEANPEAIKAIFEAADFPTETAKQNALKAVDDVIKTRGWRQRFIGRKDVPGYTTDFAPVIASYLNGYAGFISKLRAAKAMRGAILDIDPTIKPELYKFAHDYTNYTLTDTPEFQKARGAMFMWYLAGNVKTALIQPTANFTSFYPLLATKTKGAFWKTNKAMTDVARNYPALVSDTGKPSLKPEEVKFLKEGLKEGELGMGGLAEISGVKGNVFFNRLSGATSKGMRALAAPLAIAEKYSRLSSGLAAFRHFRFEKGMDYAAAKKAAYDLSNEAQGRYGKGNRAPIEQGRPGVVMAFKHFSLNYLHMLKNMAKNKEYGGLVRSAAMMTVLAGTTGWPLAKVLTGAYRTVFKKDPEEEVRKAAGEFGGRALTRGLPAAFGADLSGSIGAGDILPLTNLRDESDIARALIGPGWDLAIHRPYIAWQQAKKGDLRGLAETASPEFIRQKMVARRGATEGIKGFGTLTPGEAALKSFGVMPTRLSEYYHKKYEVGKLDDDKAPPALDWTRPRRRERRRRVEW